jgi:uncharacterized protein (TIGR02246 family)
VTEAVLDTVQAHLAAFNAGDLDKLVDLFAEDAVFATVDQLVIGRRGVRALFGDAFDQPITAALHLQRAVVEGDTAACELVETLTFPDGQAAEMPVAAFYTVRDGTLVRVRVYRDVPA